MYNIYYHTCSSFVPTFERYVCVKLCFDIHAIIIFTTYHNVHHNFAHSWIFIFSIFSWNVLEFEFHDYFISFNLRIDCINSVSIEQIYCQVQFIIIQNGFFLEFMHIILLLCFEATQKNIWPGISFFKKLIHIHWNPFQFMYKCFISVVAQQIAMALLLWIFHALEHTENAWQR